MLRKYVTCSGCEAQFTTSKFKSTMSDMGQLHTLADPSVLASFSRSRKLYERVVLFNKHLE